MRPPETAPATAPDGPDPVRAWRERVEARKGSEQKRTFTAGQAREYDLHLQLEGYPGDRLDALLALVPPGGSLLDVGAGTGLWAIPAARAGVSVTAVEPRAPMRDVLAAKLDAEPALWRLVEVVPGRWEDVRAETHDVVLAAHSLYGMPRIDRVLDAMTAAARHRVAVYVRTGRWPGKLSSRFNRERGVRRLPTTNWDDLRAVLEARGVAHAVELIRRPLRPPGADRPAPSAFPEAVGWLEQRLMPDGAPGQAEHEVVVDAWVTWRGEAR